MRIVYIATSTIPSRTANSIHVMKMCQAFAQNGHEVTLIAPDKQINYEPGVEDVFSFYSVEECFKIERIPWLLIKGKGLVYGFCAGKKAKSLRPDLVYGRDIFGCFFAALLRLPVMLECHGPIENKVSERIFLKLISSQTFEKLVVITHALKKSYIEQYPSLSEKIIVAPDGADPIPDCIKPAILPNGNKRLQVGYVGHLYPGRGIEVIEQLADRCPWADFHVVGGTVQDINACKQRAISLNNLYLHGFKQPSEAERYRLGCDVLLAPYQRKVSVSGGGDTVKWMSPLKVFEYMAAGKAIICSDIPVLREVLEDGYNVLLCPPEDINSWTRALALLCKNKNMRSQLAENAKMDFMHKYTWGSRAQNILLTLKEEE